MAYFKKVYSTFQPKDLEMDEYMLADTLERFGKSSAVNTIGFGLDLLLDLIQSCKPYLRQADRKPRASAWCVAC